MATDELTRHADRLAPQLVAWRRDLHQHPELGFEERRTAGLVAARLIDLGLELRTEVAVTGVVGLLRASKPVGRATLLRADMDALPVQEVGGRDYGSRVDGRMHACGHDGHTAMLLGAATLLAARREMLTRDVVFCFQPGEEGMGGAERMIEEGVLDWVSIQAAYALHLWSGFEHGTVHVRCGPTMAAQDEFRACIRGKGGHGALPHQTLDPIVVVAEIVGALQTIVSRSVDPIESAVVTVGSLHAGSAPNVIPDSAEIRGTLRSFSETTRELLRRRVREIVEGTAQTFGCKAELEILHGYPAVVNDTMAVERVRSAARAAFGEANVLEPAPMAAAEDFAYFLQRVPGAFIFVGAGNRAKGIDAPHHSARFDIDESVLPRGAELLARLALMREPDSAR